MPYIDPKTILEAKKMDLLTYLKNYEPGELVCFSANTYCTRTYDSLKISNAVFTAGIAVAQSSKSGGTMKMYRIISFQNTHGVR